MAARRRAIRARNAPQTDLPISHGIVVGNLVYTSGQIGTNPKTGKLVPGGIEEQTRQTIENLAAILRAAGSSLDKGVKTTVYLTNMKEFPRMNSVYRTFFRREPPARSTVEVTALALKGARIEIEIVASR